MQTWMRNPRVCWEFLAARGGAWWLRCWWFLFWVLYIKVLRRFLWVDFLWNLVRSFRNLGWETVDVVGLITILVYIVVLMLAALTGGWLRLDLRVKREMVSHHFFVSLHWMSSFIFKFWCRLPWPWVHAKADFLYFSCLCLRSFLYKGMLFAFLHHWGTCLTFSFLLLLSRFFF